MPLVKKADLEAANASSTITKLMNDKDDTQKLIGALEDFISSSSSELVGAAFDAVRQHIKGYIDVLQTRSKLSDSLIEAIKKANESLISYMDDQAILDTDELDSYRIKRDYAKAQYDYYIGRIESYDPDTNSVSLSSLQENAAKYDAEYKKLNKIVTLLEGLPGADQAAYSDLLSCEQEVSTFKNSISGIGSINY